MRKIYIKLGTYNFLLTAQNVVNL